jgi:hypothetical protein
MAKIETCECVILVLQNPREKFWGVLGEINQSGIFVRGIDLNAFEDFVRSINSNELFMGLSDVFFPMWRVERLTRDENSLGLPSMAEQFLQRTGLRIEDF